MARSKSIRVKTIRSMCAACCTYRKGLTPAMFAMIVARCCFISCCGIPVLSLGSSAGEDTPRVKPTHVLFNLIHAVPLLVSGRTIAPRTHFSVCFVSMSILASGTLLTSRLHSFSCARFVLTRVHNILFLAEVCMCVTLTEKLIAGFVVVPQQTACSR